MIRACRTCKAQDWSAWSACDSSCNWGNKHRRRALAPSEFTCEAWAGLAKDGIAVPHKGCCRPPVLSESQPCYAAACPPRSSTPPTPSGAALTPPTPSPTPACLFGGWGAWSDCPPAPCGSPWQQSGTQKRTRSAYSPQPFHNASGWCASQRLQRRYCPAAPKCKPPACVPQNCRGLGPWGGWGSCQSTRGDDERDGYFGVQARDRSATTQPACGGAPCPPLWQQRQCAWTTAPTPGPNMRLQFWAGKARAAAETAKVEEAAEEKRLKVQQEARLSAAQKAARVMAAAKKVRQYTGVVRSAWVMDGMAICTVMRGGV
jgi:hypothetical protein